MVIGLLGAVAAWIGEAALPTQLQMYLEQQRSAETEMTAAEWTVLGLALPLLAASIASFVGMLKFRRHSRSLSVAASLVALATLPLFGPTVEPGIATVLYHLSSTLYGAVMAISYLPPVSGWFQDPPATPATRSRSV